MLGTFKYLALFFFCLSLFFLKGSSTEVNFMFGEMIGPNSVSCEYRVCPPSEAEELQEKVQGEVVSLESDPAVYDQLISTRALPRDAPYTPRLVVVPESKEDIIEAVKFARKNHYEVSVKNGGHSPDGLSLTRRGLQINLSKLNTVQVNVEAKTAIVGAGANNKDVNSATEPHNLAHVGGNVGSIGFSGQYSVGGYGSLSRLHGLSLDNVISVELVTWEGRLMTVTEESDAELFWAVQGAMSNFGIAVEWEIELHDVSSWYGGFRVYPSTFISPVLQWVAQNTEEMNFHFRGIYLTSSQIFLAEFAHWDANLTTAEKEEFFESLDSVAPFLNSDLGSLTYFEAVSAHDESAVAGPPARVYGTGGGVNNPTPEYLDKFQELCLDIDSPAGDCRFELWGGAIKEKKPDESAFWSRQSDFIWTFEPYWMDPSQDQFWIQKATEAHKTLTMMEGSTADCYPNYVSPDFAEACYGDNILRLRELKDKYDPINFFHRNFNIK